MIHAWHIDERERYDERARLLARARRVAAEVERIVAAHRASREAERVASRDALRLPV
jgi:hypothetical protein